MYFLKYIKYVIWIKYDKQIVQKTRILQSIEKPYIYTLQPMQ